MKQRISLIIIWLAAFSCSWGNLRSSDNYNINYQNNRSPLTAKPYIELPIGAVKPHGWLHEQLKKWQMA